MGKCPNCGSWNSFTETVVRASAGTSSKPKAGSGIAVVRLKDVGTAAVKRTSSGLSELDRVLGGGLVPGSVILLSGEPGIGKSTLLLQVASHLGGMYVAGEESAEQIKVRADRLVKAKLNKVDRNLFENIEIVSSTNIDEIEDTIRERNPNFLIVDSIQTLNSDALNGPSGSVGQVRECVDRLFRLVKAAGITTILVGHVTKEGTIAGPKVVEHIVDAVLYLEGEEHRPYRILRASKNRFGRVEEIGVFEMTEAGMNEVSNPSEMFLENRIYESGSVVVPIMEGDRPLLTEIQALTSRTVFGIPKRSAYGVDVNRVSLIATVLSRRAGISLDNQDIFVNVAGGLKVNEPAVDLGIALAIASSALGEPGDPKTVVVC